MRFAELVLQGVRNFQDTFRLPIGGGWTVFVAGAGAGKSTIVDVLFHVLYPDTTEPGTSLFLSPAGGPCRVALLLESDKGERYRLVQDLASGAIALTRHDAQQGSFVPVSSTPAEIMQYLGSQLHMPQRDVLEGVYLLREQSLPSMMPRAPAATTAAELATPDVARPERKLPPSPHFPPEGGGGGGFPGYQGMDAGQEVLPDDPAEIRQQIEVLERDLAIAVEVDEQQFKLDGLQSELFEIEQKFKGVQQAEGRVVQVEERLKEFERLGELPGDFENRVRDFRQSKEKLDRDMGRLDEEQQRWEKRAQEEAPGPLKRNHLFLIGLAVGMVSLAVGVAGFFTFEPLRYVALLDIAGFGLAMVMAVRHIDKTGSLERSQARLSMIDERREKLQRQFDLESSIVRKTMQDVGVDNPAQIIEQYNRRNKLQAELEEARQNLEQKKAESGLEEVSAKKQALEEQIAEIEGKLAGASGLMMSPREMERKLAALRERLQIIESGGTPPAASSAGQDIQAAGAGGIDEYGNVDLGGDTAGDMLGVGAPPGAAVDGFGAGGPPGAALHPKGKPGLPRVAAAALPVETLDPCQRLVKLAEDLFLGKREQVEPMLAPRAGQYLAALSGQTYTRLGFAADGSVQCSEASGTPVSFAQMPAAVQDLVYLALRFTVIEAFSHKQPVPVLLDDPFSRLPANLHDLTGRMLAGLGGSTQVIMFTGQSSWSQYATASFHL